MLYTISYFTSDAFEAELRKLVTEATAAVAVEHKYFSHFGSDAMNEISVEVVKAA